MKRKAPAKKNPEKKKKKKWLLIILVLAGLGVGGFFGWKHFIRKDDPEKTADVEPEPDPEPEVEPTPIKPPPLPPVEAANNFRGLTKMFRGKDVEGLMKSAEEKSKDAAYRARALQFLEQLKDRRAVPVMRNAMEDPDKNVRRAAMRGLKRFYEPALEPVLLQALEDEDPHIRALAVPQLVRLKSKKALPTFLAMLKDPEWQVRLQAVMACGKFEMEEAIEPLIPMLEDPEAQVRQASAESIAAIGDPGRDELIAKLRAETAPVMRSRLSLVLQMVNEWDRRIEEEDPFDDLLLEKILKDENREPEGKRAIPQVLLGLRDGREQVRFDSAMVLDQVLDPRGVKPLTVLLKEDKSIRIRRQVAITLGKLKDPQAIPFLDQALREDDRKVRRYAARALEWIGEKSAATFQSHFISADASEVQMAGDGLLALGAAGQAMLLSGLNHKDERVKIASIRGMGHLGDETARTGVELLLSDPVVEVRSAARIAMEELDPEKAAARLAIKEKAFPKSTIARDGWIGVLTDEDWVIRRTAIHALRRIGGDPIPEVRARVKDRHFAVRAEAVRAVGTFEDKEGIELLFERFEDPDRYVRWVTVAALAEYHPEDVFETVFAGLSSDRVQIRTLSKQSLELLLRRQLPFSPEGPERIRENGKKKIREIYDGMKQQGVWKR